MSQFEPTYRQFGERSILVEWHQKIDKNILKDIVNFKNRLKKSNIKFLVEINSTYNSLLISYDTSINNIYDALLSLKKLYLVKDSQKNELNKLWEIPVYYDANHGVDLDNFSKENKLTKKQIIELHSAQIYTVYFIGFLPGFLYLGGLDKRLHLPRKSTPNLHVKKGSVAIGGEQTGIYPQDSPGGWHIIGNSPIDFFDISKEIPCFASPGDCVKFVPVDNKTYKDIKTLVDAGVYQLEREVMDG